MRAGTVAAIAGIIIGVVGLGIDFQIIMSAPPVTADGVPVERSLVGQHIYFWSFFTHLTNLGLVLVYLGVLTGWGWLSWFRHPVGRTSMAGSITLVMVFFHFMLAPLYHFTGGLLIANYMLHYVAPIFYLAWWFIFCPHGTLRFADIPQMLVYGIVYVVLVLIRGAIVNDYPYAILNAGKSGYGSVAVGVGIILAAVAAFCAVLVFADRLLGRRALCATGL